MNSNFFHYCAQANKTRDHESEAEDDSEGGEEESKGSLEVTEEVRLFFCPHWNDVKQGGEGYETETTSGLFRSLPCCSVSFVCPSGSLQVSLL